MHHDGFSAPHGHHDKQEPESVKALKSIWHINKAEKPVHKTPHNVSTDIYRVKEGNIHIPRRSRHR